MKFLQFFRRLLKNWPAKMLSLVAAICLFLFYRVNSLEDRFFTVPLRLQLSEGYVAAGPHPRSVRVSLRGEGETVSRILEEDIRVFADFTAYSREGEYRASVEVLTQGSAEEARSLEITVEPRELSLNIERKLRKTVKVLPTMAGYPEKGFELVQYFINPSDVDVEGPRSRVNNLETVLTERVELSGRSSDFTFQARILMEDPYITFPIGRTVEFLGLVREVIITKNFINISMVSFDLDPRFRLVTPPQTGSIRLQGGQINVGGLDPDDLFLSIDCSQITEPGLHIVSPRPEVPPGVSILNWTPDEITLEVAEVEVVKEPEEPEGSEGPEE